MLYSDEGMKAAGCRFYLMGRSERCIFWAVRRAEEKALAAFAELTAAMDREG